MFTDFPGYIRALKTVMVTSICNLRMIYSLIMHCSLTVRNAHLAPGARKTMAMETAILIRTVVEAIVVLVGSLANHHIQGQEGLQMRIGVAERKAVLVRTEDTHREPVS